MLTYLLCRGVAVAGLHCRVLPMYCQSTFNFSGLNSFLTCCCAGELQFASCTAKCFQCTVRVLSIFFGLNSFLTYSCVGELQSPGCTVCCQVPPSVLSSVFFQGVTSVVKSISSSSGFSSHSSLYSRLYKFQNLYIRG